MYIGCYRFSMLIFSLFVSLFDLLIFQCCLTYPRYLSLICFIFSLNHQHFSIIFQCYPIFQISSYLNLLFSSLTVLIHLLWYLFRVLTGKQADWIKLFSYWQSLLQIELVWEYPSHRSSWLCPRVLLFWF